MWEICVLKHWKVSGKGELLRWCQEGSLQVVADLRRGAIRLPLALPSTRTRKIEWAFLWEWLLCIAAKLSDLGREEGNCQWQEEKQSHQAGPSRLRLPELTWNRRRSCSSDCLDGTHYLQTWNGNHRNIFPPEWQVHSGVNVRDGWIYRGEAAKICQSPLVKIQNHKSTCQSLLAHPSTPIVVALLVALGCRGQHWHFMDLKSDFLPHSHAGWCLETEATWSQSKCWLPREHSTFFTALQRSEKPYTYKGNKKLVASVPPSGKQWKDLLLIYWSSDFQTFSSQCTHQLKY